MSRIRVFKALTAVLILNVMVFAFVSGCDDNNGGGGGMNCCQFAESCQENIGQQNCTDQGGVFVQNAQCVVDPDLGLGLCIPVATPTPVPTPSPTPTPIVTPTPTPTATATPTPTPTPIVSPTPTPTPTGPPTCEDVPARMDDAFFEQFAVTYTGEAEVMVCDSGDNADIPCGSDADCPPDGQCVPGEPIQIVKVLTSDLTPPLEPLCTLVLNTEFMFMGLSINVAITTTGVITMDGSMCIFDGADATVMVLGMNVDATIVSGSATLSGDGQLLSLAETVVDVGPPLDMQVSVPAVGPCTCESVEPIVQEVRVQEAQRIHSEKMKELGIDMGN